MEGNLVPSPRIFFAGGPLASLQLRFLLVPGSGLASGVSSGSDAASLLGLTSAGAAAGATRGNTASQH